RELLEHRFLLQLDGRLRRYPPTARPSSRNLLPCGRAYAWSTQVGTRARVSAGGCAARYSVGVRPYVRPNVVVNEPTLLRPTVKQMSAIDRSVLRSSSAARSSRRVSRDWW